MTSLVIAGDVKPPPNPTDPRPHPINPLDQHLKAGRTLFAQKKFDAALEQFKAALDASPKSRDARLGIGLSLYWLRKPQDALDHFNALLDKTKRNSDDEWQIQQLRLLAITALEQDGAAEQVLERLYELHTEGKCKSAAKAGGFVREHLYSGKLLAEAWQVFDDHGEVQDLFMFAVNPIDAPADAEVLRTLSVEAAVLPGGGNGFVLAEETDAVRRVYKRWAQIPRYEDIRPGVLEILAGKLAAVEEQPAAGATAKKTTPATTPSKEVRTFAEDEVALSRQVEALGLDPAVSRMLTVSARLREIKFDVTRLARLNFTDPVLAERLLRELRDRHRYAQDDAAELVDLISKAKAEHLKALFDYVPRLGKRQPFLDFALLTGLNTRGGDAPAAYLDDAQKSHDFLIRQTACLIRARQGDRKALEQLVREAQNADVSSAAILNGSLEELLGRVLPVPPVPGGEQSMKPLREWQTKLTNWWKQNGENLQFTADPKPGQPYWK